MDGRVQGLHSAAQHLRVSGQFGHIPDAEGEREKAHVDRGTPCIVTLIELARVSQSVQLRLWEFRGQLLESHA